MGELKNIHSYEAFVCQKILIFHAKLAGPFSSIGMDTEEEKWQTKEAEL